MTDRIACCIMFCKRTTRRDRLDPKHSEWICREHWKTIPKKVKRRKAKADKIYKRADAEFCKLYGQQGGVTEAQYNRIRAAQRLANLTWERCKEAVTHL